MKQRSRTTSARVRGLTAFASFLILVSCASTSTELLKTELDAQAANVRATSADYAGDVRFGFTDGIEARGKSVPFTLNAGLRSVTPTRLGFRGLLDLREFQAQAPQLLSGPLEEGCALNVVANLDEIGARGDLIGLVGTVDVELYRCRGEKTQGVEG